MKKFAFCCMISLLLLLLAAGCTYESAVTVKSDESSNDSSWQMSYDFFDGTKMKKINIDDAPCIVKGNITTEAGRLDFTVIGTKDEIIATRENLPTGEFAIELAEPGTYWLQWAAEEHKGAFTVTWQ